MRSTKLCPDDGSDFRKPYANGSVITAAKLTSFLQRYRRVCYEMESLKKALTNSESSPVPVEKWSEWKAKCCPESHRGLACTIHPCPQLSDDPRYQLLVILDEEACNLQVQYMSDDFFRDQETLIQEVIRSFPSLREAVDPWCTDMSLFEIFHAGEDKDPQAYYAALFVEILLSIGRSRHESDPVFYLDKAFEVWDDQHKQAFVHWITMPFFPETEFCRISTQPPLV